MPKPADPLWPSTVDAAMSLLSWLSESTMQCWVQRSTIWCSIVYVISFLQIQWPGFPLWQDQLFMSRFCMGARARSQERQVGAVSRALGEFKPGRRPGQTVMLPWLGRAGPGAQRQECSGCATCRKLTFPLQTSHKRQRSGLLVTTVCAPQIMAHFVCVCVCVCVCVLLGFKLRTYTLSHSTNSFLWWVFSK
jgi:hypothetical protein